MASSRKRTSRKRKRQRRGDKAQYGRTARKNWHEYEPVYRRWRHVCEVLFSGDAARMADAVDMNRRDFKRVLFRHSHLTIRLAAHLVAKLGVNAEWLLCGHGPMMKPAPDDTAGFLLPAKLTTAFPPFDSIDQSAGTDFLKTTFVPLRRETVCDEQTLLIAARAVYGACRHKKPVGVFLGQQAFACRPLQTIVPFFTEHYATVLVATLASACADAAAAKVLPGFDVNSVARAAAIRGAGYGETLASAIRQDGTAEQSVLATVGNLHVPVLISAELGEISRHTAPAPNNAEIGAAIGAAAYADLLVLTAQLENFFGQPGGVWIVVGDAARGVRLVLERFESLKLVARTQTGFTFLVFSAFDAGMEAAIQRCGGSVIFLDEPTVESLARLRATCAAVYAGKVSYEQND